MEYSDMVYLVKTNLWTGTETHTHMALSDALAELGEVRKIGDENHSYRIEFGNLIDSWAGRSGGVPPFQPALPHWLGHQLEPQENQN
jgi:hypothetical protein